MISKPTVFITGAGASSEFNFPLGTGLLEKIQNEIATTNKNIGKIISTNFQWSIEHAEEFRLKLRKAVPRSIDSFIELNEHYRSVAQFYIAYSLLRCEVEGQIFNRTPNYLHFIWNEMINGIKTLNDFKLNRVHSNIKNVYK